ncbi:ribosomal protein [Hirsutella rhossiliensis]|uniref:Small ribosomal subunit protein bS18m n=1 Tax=Hirsutella rhossiliensis TaxID=111463 RepID=A0A9P8MR19_9HYPO|nr:ribosomal protein s18 domain-containing protein [Hirsutella rhossiliensis]KAH0959670.1 ribosomal protein s18 domain-containing protein [Hirsutella rhossiliensis]
MPPRLPLLRAPSQPSLPPPTRALFFSSTARAALDMPNQPAASSSAPSRPPPTSSTSNLLSIDGRRGGAHQGSQDRLRAGNAAGRLIDRYKKRAEIAGRSKQSQLEFMHKNKDSQDYLRQMPRRFEPGDVYSPHDLSPVEMAKWRRRSQRNNDVVDTLGIRPLDMYKNFSLIQDFTTSSGQVIHSSATGLRPVNQRKIAKMIRRVQGMGIYPSIHDHPEMMRLNFFPVGNVDR